jgi:hypothetical protein
MRVTDHIDGWRGDEGEDGSLAARAVPTGKER